MYFLQKTTLVATLLGFSATSLHAQADQAITLQAGSIIEKTIAPTKGHRYEVNLASGEALLAQVEQQGIDVQVDVYRPVADFMTSINTEKGPEGTEQVALTAPITGTYTVIVFAPEQSTASGAYTLTVKQVRSVAENARIAAKKELPTETLFNLWEACLEDEDAMEGFIDGIEGQHFIEPIEGDDAHMLVTYFCFPPPNIEYVMLSGGPDFLGLRFRQMPGLDMHYVTQRVPKDARFNYGFNYFLLDRSGPNGEVETRNVDHVYDGVVEMPMAPSQPYLEAREGVAKGSVVPTAIQSTILDQERKITVHTPANYDANLPHNLLIVFDGETYGGRPGRRARIPAPTIMDNLTAEGKITPTVTVLVWNMGQRSKDLISEAFGDFVAMELIPWARENYNIHPDADKVILAGSSRGGFAASYIALRHSAVIGNVLSQSGSYWIKGTEDENHWIYPEDNGLLINAYKASPALPIRFYMDVGLYDAGASMLGMNRQFRDILELKGYAVDYHEFKGGHSYVNWRGTLSDGLISLIGTE